MPYLRSKREYVEAQIAHGFAMKDGSLDCAIKGRDNSGTVMESHAEEATDVCFGITFSTSTIARRFQRVH